jgi:putative ABC transport system permease protein
MAMRTFISQKLEHIAVLKALGASSLTVMSVFLLEAGMLGVGGSIVGAGLGLGVQLLLPKLFEGLYPVGPIGLNWTAALGGLAAGVGIALLSALIPVRAIRAIKPVALFRGETGAAKMGWKAWVEAILTGLLTLAGVAWMAVTYAKSTTMGLGFLGGLLGATLLLFIFCWLIMRLARLLPQKGRPAIRHAIRSLNAPGNQSGSVMVAMSLGILLMTLVYLVQSVLIQQIKTVGVGPNTPNVFIMSMKPERRGEMAEYLAKHHDVRKVLDTTLAVAGVIESIDGKSAADLDLKEGIPEVLADSPPVLPKGVEIVAGEWFTAADQGQPKLTVMERFATAYGLKVGSTITMKVRTSQQSLTFTVASIWRQTGVDGVSTMAMANLSTAPGALDAYADNFMVSVVTKPHREEFMMGDLLEEFPEAMPVSLEAYVQMFESLLNRVANILRFLTAFAVVAAGVILSGSLSATRFRRRKESALLKTLGASRLTVATASALENGLLGIVAGLAGGGLALSVVQTAGMMLEMRLELGLAPLWLSALAGGLLAVLVGVGSTLDVLRVKPLSVLRSE